MKARVVVAILIWAGCAVPVWANPPIQMPGGSVLFNVPVKSLVELRFKNIERQAYDISCGAAAMATLLKYYYQEDVREQSLVDAMMALGDKEKIQQEGFSLLEMKRFAEQRGYVANGYRISDAQKLANLKIPYVALVNVRGYAHFVIVKGIANGEVFIADPAYGNRSRTLESFANEWNGVILVILHPGREGNSAFTMDSLPKASMEQVVPIIQRLGSSIWPRGAAEY
jgi:predicted double-glycine peptidase